jgi:galactitol-specific phosphotransferase system IIC component
VYPLSDAIGFIASSVVIGFILGALIAMFSAFARWLVWVLKGGEK